MNLDSTEFDFQNEDEAEIFMETMRTVSLTRNEALFIDDNVTLQILQEPDERNNVSGLRVVLPSAVIAVTLDILEKVGMAILSLCDPDNPIEEYKIQFSISELYTLREICTSFIKVGNEPVGGNLKRKIYKAILQDEYRERKAFEQLVGDIPFPSWDMEEQEVKKQEN